MSTRRQIKKKGSLKSSLIPAANPLKSRGFGKGIQARSAQLPNINPLQTRPFATPSQGLSQQQETRSIEEQMEGAAQFGYNAANIQNHAPETSQLPVQRKEGKFGGWNQPPIQRVDPVMNRLNMWRDEQVAQAKTGEQKDIAEQEGEKEQPEAEEKEKTSAIQTKLTAQQTGGKPSKILQRSANQTTANPSITTDQKGIIRRGEAGVHHGIETEATGSEVGLSDPNAVEQMYAGNWMRDFSQVNVPVVFSALERIPSRVDAPTGDNIGAEGAEDLAVGLLRALSMLEFGPEITNRLITAENIGVYTPEQHIDNPIGTTAADHLVRDDETGNLRPGQQTTLEEDPTGRVEPANSGWHPLSPDTNDPVCQVITRDVERDQQLAGSALPGLQVENPDLYRVSDTGLANHIYNSIEWAKSQLTMAAQGGATPEGRMHLGAGLHVVEDYFAHSNFIEVALNGQIDRALWDQENGKQTEIPPTFVRAVAAGGVGANHVDTLYDAQVGNRRAITTGSFGSLDTKVSIAHVILPKLPTLGNAIDNKIDAALALVKQGDAGWNEIKEMLESDEAGLAVLELVNAFDRHVQAPVYTGVELTYGEWDIPFTDRVLPYPNGMNPTKEYKGIKAAYDSYAKVYEAVHDQIDRIREFRDSLFWPFTAISGAITALITQLKELLNKALEELRHIIKGQINQLMFNLIEQVTGLDIPKEKKKSIGDAVDWAHHVVEGMEHQTSLESRLSGDEGEAADLGAVEKERIFGIDAEGNPIQPLPPSHSEISKDHPPHEMMPSHDTRWQYQQKTFILYGTKFTVEIPMPVEDEEHESSEGSIFFELHRQLALEADRHIIAQMDQVWNGLQPRQTSEEGMLTATSPHNDTQEMLTDARQHQDQEAERAHSAGRSFATGQDAGIEGLPDVLALVDMFIAHPEDSTWWRSIVNNYVQANEAEVIAHIKSRNLTRSHR